MCSIFSFVLVCVSFSLLYWYVFCFLCVGVCFIFSFVLVFFVFFVLVCVLFSLLCWYAFYFLFSHIGGPSNFMFSSLNLPLVVEICWCKDMICQDLLLRSPAVSLGFTFHLLLLCSPAISLGFTIPSSWMVHAGCVFVASIHPSKTWTSGSFESMRWNAYLHRLYLSLYSYPKEFRGNGVRTHVNSKGKITFTGTILLRGAWNPRGCIKQDSQPNTLTTSYSGPFTKISEWYLYCLSVGLNSLSIVLQETSTVCSMQATRSFSFLSPLLHSYQSNYGLGLEGRRGFSCRVRLGVASPPRIPWCSTDKWVCLPIVTYSWSSA